MNSKGLNATMYEQLTIDNDISYEDLYRCAECRRYIEGDHPTDDEGRHFCDTQCREDFHALEMDLEELE